jgi:hypothetical protein
MSEDNKADQILAALPWRCFQCDFVTSDPEEASAHFGDRDDGEEFKPICKWWDRMVDDCERISTLQDTIRDLNRGSDENMRLLTKIEGLEYQVESQLSVIHGYKPFSHCNSIYDVFCLFDSMEGRALTAEERLRAFINDSASAPVASSAEGSDKP